MRICSRRKLHSVLRKTFAREFRMLVRTEFRRWALCRLRPVFVYETKVREGQTSCRTSVLSTTGHLLHPNEHFHALSRAVREIFVSTAVLRHYTRFIIVNRPHLGTIVQDTPYDNYDVATRVTRLPIERTRSLADSCTSDRGGSRMKIGLAYLRRNDGKRCNC